MTGQTCAGKVWEGFSCFPCSNKGKLEHDGKLWCGIHHPPTEAARKEKRDVIKEAERQAQWKRIEAAERERVARRIRAIADDTLVAECERRGWKVTRGD